METKSILDLLDILGKMSSSLTKQKTISEGVKERIFKVAKIFDNGTNKVEKATLNIDTDMIRTGFVMKETKPEEKEYNPVYNPNFSEEMREAIIELISFVSEQSEILNIELEIKAWQPNGELYYVTSEYNKQTGFFKVNEHSKDKEETVNFSGRIGKRAEW